MRWVDKAKRRISETAHQRNMTRSRRFIQIKKFLPRTLFGRSMLILVTPVILIQIMSTYIFFERHWTRISSRLAFAVAGETAVIADQIENDGSPVNVKRIAGYAAQNLELLISYDAGARLAPEEYKLHQGEHEGWETVVAALLADAVENQVRRPFGISVDGEEKWIYLSVQLEGGVLHVTLPQNRLFSSSGYIFLLWMLGISIVLLLIALLFMRGQIRPIRKLATAAERFGKGRDVPAFKPEGASEVRKAAEAFLDMHERVRRQISQRTAMLAGISHDLRTPLTRLKLQLEMLGDSPDVDACKADIQTMERMIEGYLDFARGESGEAVQQIDLQGLLEKVVSSSKRQGAETALYTEGDLALSVRPLAFERCLNNVVSNARKYGSQVWIAARRLGDVVEITVEDDGPGIAEDKFEDVFRPFYREDSSRNIDTGGVGLGLPIAMDIIHSHGGQIWLEKSNRGGLRVVMQAPV